MSTLPKISIVTPSFNQGSYIERTITSVLDQDYPNLEYFIIDGGSSDETVEVIKKYEKHLSGWVSDKDSGQSDAINKGIRKCNGEVINWINSDDWFAPGSLKRVGEAFSDPQLEVLCGYSILEFGDKIIQKRTTQIGSDLSYWLPNSQIMQPSTFWRSEMFLEVTPVEESLHFMMDYWMWVKYLVSHGRDNIKYVDDVFSHVLMHEDAKSVSSLYKFKEDKERIIFSLLNSLGTSNRDTGLECTHNPNFIDGSSSKEIEFNFLFRKLFNWNERGERGAPDLKVWTQLITRFPLKFAKALTQKVKPAQ